jgi:hypothetical protein
MSLRKDAVELSKILNQIVASGSDSRSAYVAELARGIAENVASMTELFSINALA